MMFKSNHVTYQYVIISSVMFVYLALGSATAAHANTLGLAPTGWPDITSGNLFTSYSYDPLTYTGHLTAHDGQWESVLNNTLYIDNGEGNNTFSLDMWIDVSGHAYCDSSSTITISGDMWNEDMSDYLVTGPTLLTGTLAQFGFSGPGEQLELIFNVTGGNLQTPEYFPSAVGMLLHGSGFNGVWTQPFSVNTAISDLFNVPVPEPSCLVMFSTLVIGGWMVFRRQMA